MDDAVRARVAAREALSDIEPTRLHEVLRDRLADASMTPGALTHLSARALDAGVDPDGVSERAAGVQLIYEGLRLTRTLAHEEPWEAEEELDVEADIDVLAADVLVSRGFYLLARTEAAGDAVETIRAFGRDQTLRGRPSADVERLDCNLESDVFELAVVAGTTAVGGDPPARLRSYAATLARDAGAVEGELPPPTALPDATADRIAALSERVPSSATDP